jgi:hypothetical protein
MLIWDSEANRGDLVGRIAGAQVWRQLEARKKQMLDQYDAAKSCGGARIVQTHHGLIAESQFRAWLLGFVPKRFGVTSGFIILQGQPDTTKVRHFDVIIYDQWASPVLWVENDPDRSDAGMSQAVPAEHVRAVFEVKAAFTSRSVEQAIQHIRDLDSLRWRSEPMLQKAGYNRFLPPDFYAAIVYFELRPQERPKVALLSKFVSGDINNRPDVLILRGDGVPPEFSGRIKVLYSAGTPPVEFGPKGKDLVPMATSRCKPLNGGYYAADIAWKPSVFSSFAFDLVERLNGTYRPGTISSWDAMSWPDHPDLGDMNPLNET